MRPLSDPRNRWLDQRWLASGRWFDHLAQLVHLSLVRMTAETHVVVLAAGQGTRMKSALPKVLHQSVRPLPDRLRAASRSIAVACYGDGGRRSPGRQDSASIWVRAETSRWSCRSLSWAPPTPCSRSESVLPGASGTLVLLSGDVPLLRPETLLRLAETHRRANAAATVVTATVDRPYGYGRDRANGRPDRRESWRNGTRPRRNGRFGKSTAAFTRSTSSRCSTRCAVSRLRTPRVSTT